MRIRPSRAHGSRATTLMIAVIVTGLVGFVLAAYLSLLGAQNSVMMRSQAWNASIPVVEAGCEDALEHLSVHGNTNLYCDGWSGTNGQYVMTRWVGDSTFYTVMISNWSGGSSFFAVGGSSPLSPPVITSLGYVEMPGLFPSGAAPVLADVAGTLDLAKTYIVRGVRLTARQNGLFVKA